MPEYSPESLGITAPTGGFQTGGWYNGRQYWNGTLSDPGVIHQQSNQQGAGQLVSPQVNLQSDAAQGNQPGDIERYLASQRQKSAGVAGVGGAGGGAGGMGTGGMSAFGTGGASALNLPELYKSLYKSSGVSDLESQFSNMTKGYNDAQSKINDNPFLSEASRVGRIQKLTTDYNNSVANIKNDIATKKADIETQLNIQTKQFDIDSQMAKQAMDQFNTLLGSGALMNATGDDIAAITRSTGLSSNMITSAINASKSSGAKTETIKYDDGTNQGFAIINSDTGEIISKQTLAGSKPTADNKKAVYASTDDVSKAAKALKEVDTNKDGLLSQAEYEKARKKVLSLIANPDIATSALETASSQYGRWRW